MPSTPAPASVSALPPRWKRRAQLAWQSATRQENHHDPEEHMHREQQFERGLKALRQIDPEAGQMIVEALGDVSPELGHQVIAWAFGEMYSRPGLLPRDRQLITLGILTALGGCEAELDIHIRAALSIGLAPAEITEALLHSAVYCGMPRALNGTLVAKKVFAEKGLLPIENATA
ncbi:carboxymuconolactone decarboxylase family protein [Nonomuraea sp. B12E4]|uniref:carboxymuconolactone decarboxylase family protein n=1 Tax=Nonomuraea sp. B12E4 TaxID=3153564 RepID=UPI00325D5FBE